MADEAGRRSVVPKPVQEASHGSPWLPAAWTGVGAAVVGATLAIVAVAACWLPVSGSSGRTNSAIRAGLLTFLSAVHGGITVDGVATSWLPLGMLAIVGATAWRAGSGLADAVDAMDERDPVRLGVAAVVQAASFTVCLLVAVPFATLGTSRVDAGGVMVGALVLFAVTGTVSFVRSSPLREVVLDHLPSRAPAIAGAAAAAAAVEILFGAVLSGASLVVHHDAAERLSSSLGGGTGGIPVLLLGVLSAPNAAIAGASYLSGPGFALGSGMHVSLFSGVHGTLPAFPLLAAVPDTPAGPAVWALAVVTPVVGGVVVARRAMRATGWRNRFVHALGAAIGAGVLMLVLAWQGGGAVGDGRLRTVGASAWQVGAAVAAALAVVATLALGLAAAWSAVRRAGEDDDDGYSFLAEMRPRLAAVPVSVHRDTAEVDEHAEDDAGADDLAG